MSQEISFNYLHHRKAVDRLTGLLAQETEHRALILFGSVARGDAREDSDIDAMLLVSGEFLAAHSVGIEK